MVTRLDIEYDGTPFAGWARQPGQRTVQGELEAALATLLPRPVELTVAGRTDRGVHAWGQVASYPGDPVSLRALNALTPPQIAITRSAEAPPGFDARRDARSRTYCYRLLTRRTPSPFELRRALHHPLPLDQEPLDACARLLPGRHDFTAFTPTETDHRWFERVVHEVAWHRPDPDHLELWITADAFLRHMNRALVGTMLEVAHGRRTLESFAALLEGRPRHDAGVTAPAHALYFVHAEYDGYDAAGGGSATGRDDAPAA